MHTLEPRPRRLVSLKTGLGRFFRAEIVLPALALGVLAVMASPHISNAGDDRQSVLVQQVAGLQDSLNLYRQRCQPGETYDPFTQGWQPLIDAGYLSQPPINPITGSSDIVRQPSACAGWRYDPIAGTLDACIVDPQTGKAGLLSPAR
jgi:hypothetical protein